MQLKLPLKITILCILALLFSFFIIYPHTTNANNEPLIYESKTNKERIFRLKSVDNKVYLFENTTIIKEYDINPMLLPPEDIKLLSDGIILNSMAEADSLAEDFDGR